MTPLIECVNHFFPKIVIEADPTFDPSQEAPKMKTNYSLQMLQHKDDLKKWQLQLNVAPESKSTISLPYRLDLQVVGLYEFSADSEKDELPESNVMAGMVFDYGGPMLYSSLRELVLGITSRGPWGAFRLPTITLGDPDEEAIRKTKKPGEKETKKPRAKSKSSQ